MVGMRSMPGNPWDDHTLAETLAESLEQVSILTDRQPKIAILDKGYKGVEVTEYLNSSVWTKARHYENAKKDNQTSTGDRPDDRAHDYIWSAGQKPAHWCSG